MQGVCAFVPGAPRDAYASLFPSPFFPCHALRCAAKHPGVHTSGDASAGEAPGSSGTAMPGATRWWVGHQWSGVDKWNTSQLSAEQAAQAVPLRCTCAALLGHSRCWCSMSGLDLRPHHSAQEEGGRRCHARWRTGAGDCAGVRGGSKGPQAAGSTGCRPPRRERS